MGIIVFIWFVKYNLGILFFLIVLFIVYIRLLVFNLGCLVVLFFLIFNFNVMNFFFKIGWIVDLFFVLELICISLKNVLSNFCLLIIMEFFLLKFLCMLNGKN